jgi:hypothetical protein
MAADSLGIKGEDIAGNGSGKWPSPGTDPTLELLETARNLIERGKTRNSAAVEKEVRDTLNPLLTTILERGRLPESLPHRRAAIAELLRIFNTIAEKKMLSTTEIINGSAEPATKAVLAMLAAG